jgi:F420-dependent oxidoreductase-like protein
MNQALGLVRRAPKWRENEDMQIGIAAHVAGPEDAQFIRDAEQLGVGSVWVAEAWGQDAFTPLAYLAAQTERIALGTAIAQLGARTPANLAMSAMSMQMLSGGRFRLGIGTSGPKVMEGWHGVRFDTPLAVTRETIEIVRAISAGRRLSHQGRAYQLPLPGGQGKAIQSMLPATPVPIYVAALGPLNLELTGELADGWIGNTFMPEHADVFLEPLRSGAARANRSLADLDLVIPVAVEITDDVEEAIRRHARGYAFTIGAMGSRDQNFYNAAFTRQGFGDDVRAVQELWLAGRRDAAADRVPLELGALTNLIGTPDMISQRLRLYRGVGVTTLQAKLSGSPSQRLDTLAQLVDLADDGLAAASFEG